MKLGLDFAWADEIVNAIKNSPAKIFDLIKTPLMLTLVVLVYEAEQEVPSELPQFFEKLFLTMFSHHDRLKAGFRRKHNSGLSERNLQLLFEAFCFVAMRNKFGRTLTSEQFFTSFETAKKYAVDSQCGIEDFRKDIVKVSCLMLEEGLDLTTFLHFSICEYFSASFIARSSDSIAKNFYEFSTVNYPGWNVVLAFCEKIDNYRFSKYYLIPTCSAFLMDIGSTDKLDATDSDWSNFISNRLPKFEIDYGVQRQPDQNYRPVSYGPYSPGKWGDQIGMEVMSAISTATNAALPSPLTEKQLEDLPGIFRQVPLGKKGKQYSIFLEEAISEYGEKEYLTAFKILEREVRKRLEAAKKIVHAEENKVKLFEIG